MARGPDQSAAKLETDLRSKNVRGVYLLFGKEGYLVGEYRRRLEEVALEGSLGAFNRTVLAGARAKPEEVEEAVRTVPMLGGRRLVVVERIDEGDKKQTTALLDALTEVVKANIPSAVLLVTATTVDRRRKFYKAVTKHGLAVECRPMWDRELRGWVVGEARRLGKALDPDAAHLLMDMVGNDLGKMHNELVKLVNYVGEQPSIGLEDAEKTVADLKLSTVYDLTEALGTGQLAPALLALNKLAESGAPQVRTLWFVTQHFRSLLSAREAMDRGVDPETALMQVGVRKNVVWKVKRQLPTRNVAQLRRALIRIAQLDDDLRRSKVPAQLLLDQLVLDLCERGRGVRPGAR